MKNEKLEDRTTFSAKRAGFTIIELMVAMALTMFVMVILSQAFILALDTFSGLKGIGDMQALLRTAATGLRADLSKYHFDGGRRPSDADIASNPPRQGFFMVYQGRPSYEIVTAPAIDRSSVAPNTYESKDPDGVPSYMGANHVLYFTTRLSGNGYEDFYRTPLYESPALLPPFQSSVSFLNDLPLGLPAAAAADATLTPLPPNWTPGPPAAQSVFGSPWGEICYYLLQTGTTAEPDNPTSTVGTPLYGLYRAMYVVPTNTLVLGTKYANNARNQSTFVGVSHGITGVGAPVIDFFSPEDLANAQRPIVGPKGVTGLRQTRTLPMVRWTAPGAPFVNPLPLVPPSLTWSFTTTPPQVVPRAFNDTTTAPAPIPPGGLQVLPNVLSFHVQIMPKHDPRFTTYPYWTDAEPMLSGKLPSGDSNGSALDPNNTNMQTFAARLYDTGAHHDPTTFEKLTPPTDPSKKTLPPWWASAPPPGQTIPPWPYQTYLYGNYPYPVLAVQITLRIWDPRSQQARQLTVTQDL